MWASSPDTRLALLLPAAALVTGAVLRLAAPGLSGSVPRSGAVVSAPSPGWRALVLGPSLGQLEPCGCAGGQLGGVHRLGAALAVSDPGGGGLRVACGGALAPASTVNEAWARAQLQTVWEAFGLLELDVVGLSEGDLALGLPTLADLSVLLPPEARIVATNLVLDESGSAAPFPALRRVADADPAAPAVLAFLPEGLAGEGWRTVPVEQTLAALESSGEMPSSGRPLLALVEGDAAFAAQIADALGREAVVLRHEDRGDPDPEAHAIGDHGARGGFVGARLRYVIRVEGEGPGADVTWSTEPVSENLPTQPELDFFREAYRLALAAESPTVVEQLGDGLGMHERGAFAGSDSCRECHQEAYEIWTETLHSHAVEALVDDLRGSMPATADPRCVTCHTVGYRYETGYASQRVAEEQRLAVMGGLAGVGCESCHGPGAAHVASEAPADIERGARVPGKPSLCERCHDSDNDPAFVFDKKWPLIRH